MSLRKKQKFSIPIFLLALLSIFFIFGVLNSFYIGRSAKKDVSDGLQQNSYWLALHDHLDHTKLVLMNASLPANEIFRSKDSKKELSKAFQIEFELQEKIRDLKSKMNSPPYLSVSTLLPQIESIEKNILEGFRLSKKIIKNYQSQSLEETTEWMSEHDHLFFDSLKLLSILQLEIRKVHAQTVYYYDEKLEDRLKLQFLFSVAGVLFFILISFYVIQYHKKNKLLELERKKAHNVLLAYENALQKYAIISKADRYGLITYINDQFEKISGYSQSELLGKDHRMINSGVHDSEFFKHMWDTLKSGTPWRGKICNRNKNGSLYWVDSTITPLYDEEGNIREYLSILYDITDEILTHRKVDSQREHYLKILDSMEDGYLIQNEEGMILEFNHSACNILGISKETLLNKNFSYKELVSVNEDGDKLKESEHPFARCISEKRDQKNIILGYEKSNGDRVWLLTHSILMSEHPVHVLTTFSDITDLLIEKKKLKEAQKVADIGSWEFDVESSKISWSEQMFKIFGEDPKLGEPDFERHKSTIHPEDQKYWQSTVEKALLDGKSYMMKFRVVHFDGSVVWVEARGRGRIVGGKVVQLLGTCQNVTEIVQTQQEKEFIFDSLDIGIWKWSIKKNELIWDKKMYSLFEVSEKEFSGAYEAWESTLPEEAKKEATHELQLALEGKKEFNTHFPIKTKNGDQKFIGARGVVFRDLDGTPSHMYGINWNKTKEVLLEKALDSERSKTIQQSKLASLGEMSAGIAHEINNPLAVIKGMNSLLPNCRNHDEKFNKKVQSIDKATDRIAKIVNGLRKFSRTTEEKQHFRFNLKHTLDEVFDLIKAKLLRHQVVLKPNLEGDFWIYGDEVEIEQVMINLFNNAVDANRDQKGAWVQCDLFQEGAEIVVRVIDSGNGLPKSVQEKLFQPFFTTKKVGEGTGLGLSIVKGILDEHKASIRLNNEFQNTCFEVRFKESKESKVA